MMKLLKSNLWIFFTILVGLVTILAIQVPDFAEKTQMRPSNELKAAALKVLQTRCNVCHLEQNPRRIFTYGNMTQLAPKIYKQVFIKRRMPKGTEIRLTKAEYNILKKWLLSENNGNNGNIN